MSKYILYWYISLDFSENFSSERAVEKTAESCNREKVWRTPQYSDSKFQSRFIGVCLHVSGWIIQDYFDIRLTSILYVDEGKI